MLQTLDAKLLLDSRERRFVGAGQDHERGKVGAPRQIFGKLETGTRRSSIGIDTIVEHAEAVLVAHLLIQAAHVGDFAHFERQSERVQRRPPLFALAHHIAEESKAVGLLGPVRGPLIGDVSRGGGALEQEIFLVIVGRADLHDGAREPQPGGAVVGRGGDDLAKECHTAAEIVLGECRIGVAADLRERLGGLAGVLLDLRLQRNRAVGEPLVLEGLFGGAG